MSSMSMLSHGERDELLLTSPLYDISLPACPRNCSGHGSCQDGQCLCLVQFSGGTCHEVNIGYFIAFGSIFILLGFVAFMQLAMCIVCEYHKDSKPSVRRACKLTVQKLLYVTVICATAIRGAYFFKRLRVSDDVTGSLWSAYFPVMITGFSLIVCFWAEAFHLSESSERQFLSKSSMFFIVFNLLLYLLLIAQLVLANSAHNLVDKMKVLRICNGGFALLMIVVVVFFLIYGVEVYFKVRGAFRDSELCQPGLDSWQIHMSRMGLVAQAALQLVTALFLVADVVSDYTHKFPVLSRNLFDIGFRIVEFGVALWFSCVLWNCGRPEDLWVLNPKRVFRSFDFCNRQQSMKDFESSTSVPLNDKNYNTFSADTNCMKADCWICYDPERQDAGSFIQPCSCKGDVATVHHECLKKWLMESATNECIKKCSVCGDKYQLQAHYWIPKGLRPQYWLQTFVTSILLIGVPFATYSACRSVTSSATYIKVSVTGLAILLELVSLRIFFINVRSSCQRVRVATMKIDGKVVGQGFAQ